MDSWGYVDSAECEGRHEERTPAREEQTERGEKGVTTCVDDVCDHQVDDLRQTDLTQWLRWADQSHWRSKGCGKCEWREVLWGYPPRSFPHHAQQDGYHDYGRSQAPGVGT